MGDLGWMKWGLAYFDLKIGGNLFYLIFLIYFKTIVGKFQIIYIRLKVYFNSISNKEGKLNFFLSYITRVFDNHIWWLLVNKLVEESVKMWSRNLLVSCNLRKHLVSNLLRNRGVVSLPMRQVYLHKVTYYELKNRS